MRVLITAGGTREPIDAVRVIANSSTGRLGAVLAERAAAAGLDVVLLRAGHGAPAPDGVKARAFSSSADLAALLEAEAPAADVIVHAAAVADYLPAPEAGKISSDAEELVLRMRRAPKLVDRLRALAPGALLIGFKLTAGADDATRLAAADSLLRRADLDLVVANDIDRTSPEDHEAVLLDRNGGMELCGRGKAGIADALVARVLAHARGPAMRSETSP